MIIAPKLEYYQNNFDVKCISIRKNNNLNFLKLYSNSWKILFDCVKDIYLTEKIIEFNNEKEIEIPDEKLIQMAKTYKILFYEILKQNKNKLKIKFLGNFDNINLIENHIKELITS